MPRTKDGKQETKGAPLPIVPSLQKLLKTYEKNCTQSQTSMCPAIKKDLKACINNEQILRKFILSKPGNPVASLLPVSLEPLLMTIREEGYTLGKELCVWGLQLTNPEVARLALFLEWKGRSTCPFTSLEIVDCQMGPWSVQRLGKALQLSSLSSLALDYCRFGREGIETLFSGLESNRRLHGLSLRYCGLGPQSGPVLGAVISRSAVCELHLDGNYLQCSGALALLRPLAEFAEMQRKDQAATSSPDTKKSPQLLQTSRTGSPTLNLTAKASRTATVKNTSGKKKGKKGVKKTRKDVPEAGPWLVKLYLADNGIDGKGKEGENDLLDFTQILTCDNLNHHTGQLYEVMLAVGHAPNGDLCGNRRKTYCRERFSHIALDTPDNRTQPSLIKCSAHLRELDLWNNVLGEVAAANILEALRVRKTGQLPVLKITITPQISSDTFRSIWKNSKKSNIVRKKKKKQAES